MPAIDADQQTRHLVASPLPERLIRQTIRVLTDEPLVIGQRQIDQEDNHREHDEIQGDLEEPLVAPATGPVADARGDAEKQEERRDQQVPDAANHPEHVAAVVVTQRLWRRFRDIDSCGSSVGRLRGQRRRWSVPRQRCPNDSSRRTTSSVARTCANCKAKTGPLDQGDRREHRDVPDAKYPATTRTRNVRALDCQAAIGWMHAASDRPRSTSCQ